jgi:hypothetical protein
MDLPKAYYSDMGYIWVERRSAGWPWILKAAMQMASNSNEYHVRWGVVYEGINPDVLVTDKHDMPCFEQPCECCRKIEAHQFLMVEMDS